MKQPARLGVVDWGIGGIGIARALRRIRPEMPLLYFSDAGFTPYGLLSRGALQRRLSRVFALLAEQGATSIVVACNAASTALDDTPSPLPACGVIEPAVELLRIRGATDIGVLGGARTIRSGVYRDALARNGVRIRQRIAQPLSAHIEAGRQRTRRCAADIERIVAPLRNAEVVLLACTHYPAIADAIARCLPHTELIDPADCVAQRALSRLLLPSVPHGDRFLTSGNSRHLIAAARRTWDVDVSTCERVRL